MGISGPDQIQEFVAKRRRVSALMNAIAGLRGGDLHAVLDLDKVAPLEDEGPATLDTNKARTGKELALILEDRLKTVLAIGRWGKVVYHPSD
jgi:hypothetical protein